MTRRTLSIRGQEIAIDRADFASAAAAALLGPLPKETALQLDAAFLGAESARRNRFLHELDENRHAGAGQDQARYFWQLDRDVTPVSDLTIRLYEVREDQIPRCIKCNLKNHFPEVRSFKEWMWQQDRTAEISAAITKFVLPSVNTKTRKRISRTLRAKGSPTTFIRSFPQEHYTGILNQRRHLMHQTLARGQLHELLKSAISDLSQDRRWPHMTEEQHQDLLDILSNGLYARLAIEETSLLLAFKSTMDADCVRVLQDCQAFNFDSYRWLRSPDGDLYKKDAEAMPVSAQTVQYRLQFIKSMPLFAHVYLNAFSPVNTRDAGRMLEQLDRLIQSGDEMLAVTKTERDSGKLEFAGEGLTLFAKALTKTSGVHHRSLGQEVQTLESLRAHPRTLRRIAVLPLSSVGDINVFARVLPQIIHLPLAELPKSPQGWELADLLMRSQLPLRAEKILSETRGRWSDLSCSFAARLAKAKCEGGIAAEQTLETALGNTKDYVDFLFRSLILPAAVKASGGDKQNLPNWMAERGAVENLRQHFVSHFNLNSLLEQSLQYHKAHILQQYQAVVYQMDAAKIAGTGWLPLTENFTIPQGTVYNGIDIGGTTIEWLTTPDELRREGDENKNCVRTYTSACLTNYHVLRMKAPDPSSPTGFVRTTVSIFERRAAPGQKVIMHPGQNMKYRDVGVRPDTASYAAWHWLIEQINNGQEEREKQKARAKSQVPALIQKSTGLPDFSTIDYQSVNIRRRKLKPLYDNNLPYDPKAAGVFDAVLASANQHRLLPRALRGATSAEELLEKMGVKVMDGQLHFVGTNEKNGPLRPQGRGPAAPAGGMGL